MFRSRNGIIASAVVGVSLWLLTGFLAQNRTPNIEGVATIAPGGSISYKVVQSEQTYEGTSVQVEITNNTDKTITEGRGILSSKNALGARLMQDIAPLCEGGQPLYPGESRTIYFILWNMELTEVASYSFIATQVKFVGGTAEVASR